MSPTRRFTSVPLSLLSPRRSRPGVWDSSATSSVRIEMRTTRGPSTLASTTRRRTGDDLAVVLDKRGCVQQNLGPWSARHRAYNHELWREIVETATLLQEHATWWWWWIWHRLRLMPSFALFHSYCQFFWFFWCPEFSTCDYCDQLV